MSANSAAKAPLFNPDDLQQQTAGLFNASVAWLQHHWLQILIAVAVGATVFLVSHAVRGWLSRWLMRDDTGNGWGRVVGRAIDRTGNFFLVMLAAKLVVGYAGAPSQVATTINFLWTVASVFQAAVWAREVILGVIEHRTRSEHYAGEALLSAMGLIRLLVTVVLFAIALVVVLDNLGVNVTGLVAGLGVGGIAIGLAAQGIFADLFAALAIIFDRPFRRGDAISYDNSTGTVEAIGLKSTRVRGPNGEERIISNKKLLDKEILNNTRREYRRVQFTLGVVQWTGVDVMEKLPGMVKQVVENHGMKFVRAGFASFGASSYDFDVQFDSPSSAYQDYFDARHIVGLAVIRMLNDEGIELAYPTQTDFTAAPDGGLIYPWPRRHAPPAALTGDPIRAQDTAGDSQRASGSPVDEDVGRGTPAPEGEGQ
jgi:small-conductance mechanosensitive channel